MDQERLTYIMEELARLGFGPYPAVNNNEFIPFKNDKEIKYELGQYKEVGDHLNAIGYWDNFKKSERAMFVGTNAVRFQLKYESETAEDKSFDTAFRVLEYRKDAITGALSFDKHACYIDNQSKHQEGYPKCYIYRRDDYAHAPSISHAFEMTKMIAIDPHDINHYQAKKLEEKSLPGNKKISSKKRKRQRPATVTIIFTQTRIYKHYISMKPEEFAALRKAAEQLNQTLSQNQKVCSRQCDECLFSKNKLVDDERKQQLLSECERDQTHFICHKGSIAGQNVVCNGFFRNKTTPFLDIMKATGKLEFVDPKDLQKLQPLTDSRQKKIRKAGKKRKKM